jgi:D-alanyl-D-alanine endopeptidase (penicillin-binding protein 7)
MFAETLVALISILSLQAISTPAPTSAQLRSLPVARYVAPVYAAPVKKNHTSFGVDVSAKAAVVMDVASGHILFEKNPDEALPIASLTKLVTAITLLDMEPDFDAFVDMSYSDKGRIGRTFVELDDRFTTRELIELMLIGSSNEAAHALARHHGGDAFLAAMNQKARDIGMKSAVFYDSSGLNANNKASAKDVAIVMRAVLKYPVIQAITKQSVVNVTGRRSGREYSLDSTNLLLGSRLNVEPYNVVAGKTGSLPEAGFCFAQTTRNEKGDEIIAVVLGSETHYARFQDVKALTYWTFENFLWPVRRQTAQQ